MDMLRKSMVLALFVSAQIALPAVADDGSGDDLDVTVTVVEADGSVEDVINVIELPEEASDVAKEAAAFGLAIANAARQRGEGKIEDPEALEAMIEGAAAQAAEQAREAAKNAREAAQDAAKNANEAAEEALKNALSGGATENIPEEVLDSIPDDVKDRLPIDLDTVIDDATDNVPDNIPGS